MIAAALLALAQVAIGVAPGADAAEVALLARYPKLAQRRGRTLTIRSGGRTLRYRDKTAAQCENGSQTDCSFRLASVLFDGRVLGVSFGHYEGGDYLVVVNGKEHHTGYPPVPSPDGSLMAVIGHADAYENGGEGITLYDAGTFAVVRRLPAEIFYDPARGQWRGSSCFTFDAPPEGDSQRPRRTWRLVRAASEWRLTDRPDAACETER